MIFSLERAVVVWLVLAILEHVQSRGLILQMMSIEGKYRESVGLFEKLTSRHICVYKAIVIETSERANSIIMIIIAIIYN